MSIKKILEKSEINEIRESIRGKEFSVFAALHKAASIDEEQFWTWWCVIPEEKRAFIQKRLLRLHFLSTTKRGIIRIWKKRKSIERLKTLKLHQKRLVRKKQDSPFTLFQQCSANRAMNKKEFHYFWKPLPTRTQEQIAICWWANLKNHCTTIKTLKTDKGKTFIEIRITPNCTPQIF